MEAHPEIRRSEDPEQPFYVALVGANGEDLSATETFHSKDSAYVNIVAQREALRGETIDRT